MPKIIPKKKPESIEYPFKILHGNCLDILPTLPAMSVDAVVCDPPYELGFMGKSWDSTGIANDPEMWGYVLRALKPGGYLLAFSGTRTYHRMACAIEDGGFDIRDCIMWTYGSGFPKSHNISKGIDKADGWEREKKVFEQKPGMAKSWDTGSGKGFSGTEAVVDEPISDDAKMWDGFGSALKPSLEPICVAQRPLIGSIQQNVRAYGTGGLNIDACRIGTEEMAVTRSNGVNISQNRAMAAANTGRVDAGTKTGRWPANLCHDGSPEILELFPHQKGVYGAKVAPSGGPKGVYYHAAEGEKRPSAGTHITKGTKDDGSAARFFYCAKASRVDRDQGLDDMPLQNTGSMQGNVDGTLTGGLIPQGANIHPTVKPTSLMQWLVRLVTPPGGTVLDPFTGSGSTGKACGFEGFNFLGIEMDDQYLEIAKRRILFGYQNRKPS